MRCFSIALFLSLACATGEAASLGQHAGKLAGLIDPHELAALGKRVTNPRLQKAVYVLATARTEGQKLPKVLDRAVALAGYKHAAAKLTEDALLRG